MNQVKVYPVHKESILQDRYVVKVRAIGEENWLKVPTYQVKVDMHDVRLASMAYLDFEGSIEIEIESKVYIYRVDIRPLSKKIPVEFTTKKVNFILDKPANLSIEINKDRFHNLHLFAGEIRKDIPDENAENVLVLEGNSEKYCSFGAETATKLEAMPKGRTLYIKSGIHYAGEGMFKVPSHTNIYMEGGAVVVGNFLCDHVEDVHIYGSGILYLANFERYGGKSGFQLNHSHNITIEDCILINPPHYTVALGECKNVTIRNIKSFSCEGWSDGIDMMSCQNIYVEGGFLRTSDDCIAVYGHRWSFYGDTRNVVIKGITLWADVAHPICMGTHGLSEEEGDIIEDIHFEDIDILEHHEYQAGYLGCMAINVGDKNIARNIVFDNIRIEPFEHGKIFDFQVKFNPDYNPCPGKGIENITLKNIYYTGQRDEVSVIEGYSEEFNVKNIYIENLVRNGVKVKTLEEGNIRVGKYVENVTLAD
ncbi:glycosyl hydrolase family 28 protein [Anaerosporobacter sp.]|uniref:glycosyl hydrolase family 28 protein n=1 Tax=Anaerosporobacter sp. TaxID=1872529 RepID=UPI00286F995D|nr:glycosyl hydrolase family 28 protein [Anaerosporobacter sp.]